MQQLYCLQNRWLYAQGGSTSSNDKKIVPSHQANVSCSWPRSAVLASYGRCHPNDLERSG